MIRNPCTTTIEPNDFVRWVFSRLFYNRIPRYQALADEYGYTLCTNEVAKVSSEADFLDLIADTLDQPQASGEKNATRCQ